jgi:hypothetical protein
MVDGIGRIECANHKTVSSVKDKVRDQVPSRSTHTRTWLVSAVREYISGAALALNPLPHSSTCTFSAWDSEALHSDWAAVSEDIGNVWVVLSLARDEFKSEEPDGGRPSWGWDSNSSTDVERKVDAD